MCARFGIALDPPKSSPASHSYPVSCRVRIGADCRNSKCEHNSESAFGFRGLCANHPNRIWRICRVSERDSFAYCVIFAVQMAPLAEFFERSEFARYGSGAQVATSMAPRLLEVSPTKTWMVFQSFTSSTGSTSASTPAAVMTPREASNASLDLRSKSPISFNFQNF